MKKLTYLILSITLFAACESDVSNVENDVSTVGEPKASRMDTTGYEETSDSLRNLEVVFCLDATGSMAGLLSTAKDKIWDVVSELVQQEDVHELKLGMIFYRDTKDQFVTRMLPLTHNLDSLYTELLSIEADGGGDSPESVNQALNEAVSDIQWTLGANTQKTIFVVGDCPPHMDYPNDVKYTVSCKQAAEKGITINTIKLGKSCTEAIPHFKKMSSCTNGTFMQLDQHAQDYIIETPYDTEINEVSREIDESMLYYGSKEEKAIGNRKKGKSIQLYDISPAASNSSRNSFKSSAGKKYWAAKKELIYDVEQGALSLDTLTSTDLPSEFNGYSETALADTVQAIITSRAASKDKLTELNKKRQTYIKEKEKELAGEKSFSKKVVDVMKEQGRKKETK